MFSYNTVLVTGGSGLVGTNLKIAVSSDSLLKDRFIFLSSKDANLEKYEDVKIIFKKYKPDCVVHLAANVGGLFKNLRQNCHILQSNMKINTNVITCALDFKVKKCISCLSTCIFPDDVTYPITENMLHNGPPHDSNYGYSYAKRYVDILNRAFNDSQNYTLFTSVIPCNIFGKFDNFNIDDGHVIPSLIHKAFIAKKNGESLVVWGSGAPLRQFIYARDLVRLLLKVISEYDFKEPIILANDENDEVTIREVAESIREAFGMVYPNVFETKFQDGQYKKTVSNAKLRKLWPDFYFTPFKEGIDETVKWFQENYSIARK